jgi:hypothetical protein
MTRALAWSAAESLVDEPALEGEDVALGFVALGGGVDHAGAADPEGEWSADSSADGSGAEVKDGHADGDAVMDLLEDHRAGRRRLRFRPRRRG